MLLGTDPEFFIFDEKEKKFISASEVFPKKQNPWAPNRYELDAASGSYKWHSYAGTKIFRDGFGVEINTTPCECRETLTAYVKYAIMDIETKVKEKNPNWIIVSAPLANLTQAYIDKLPEDVKMFGCDPSYSAWGQREERIELNGATHHFRYAGGHIHFGDSYDLHHLIHKKHHKTQEGRERIFKLIKILDLFIGLPLSLIFNDEGEFLRRKYYGRAGEFRFQPWGVEYRVPSSRIWNHPLLASMALGVGRKVIVDFPTYEALWEKLKKERPHFQEDLLSSINEGKGGEDLLQQVEWFYNKKTISFLSGEGKTLFKLAELSLPKHESYMGFERSLSDSRRGDLIQPGESR